MSVSLRACYVSYCSLVYQGHKWMVQHRVDWIKTGNNALFVIYWIKNLLWNELWHQESNCEMFFYCIRKYLSLTNWEESLHLTVHDVLYISGVYEIKKSCYRVHISSDYHHGWTAEEGVHHLQEWTTWVANMVDNKVMWCLVFQGCFLWTYNVDRKAEPDNHV